MDLGINQHLQENCTSLEFPWTKIIQLAEKKVSIIFSPTSIYKQDFICMCAAAQALLQQGIWEVSILTLIARALLL